MLKNWYLPAKPDKISPKSFSDNNKLKVNKTDIIQSDKLGIHFEKLQTVELSPTKKLVMKKPTMGTKYCLRFPLLSF